MQPIIDLHNHTIISGHAYSTLQEMVQAAAEKGIRYFGIADHAPSIPGAPDPLYFWNYPVIPREMYGIRLLMGVELNILDCNGRIDLKEPSLQRMDFCIAGIHVLCWSPGTKEQNTQGVIDVMHNKYVNIISHPCDGTADLCMEDLVRASRETNTLLELNSSSLKPFRNKTKAHDLNMEVLRLCKASDTPIIIGSDAHISFDVANYQHALPLIEEAAFPRELIVNYKPELFSEFTGIEL